jgi:1-acyl-sn-glycerol-3-phosphate acyltransferase
MKYKPMPLITNAILETIHWVGQFQMEIHHHFNGEDLTVNTSYPSILFANHVYTWDFFPLASIFSRTNPKVRVCAPIRGDIHDPKFLEKEFRPNELVLPVIRFLDSQNVVSKLFSTLDIVPVTRPFRDNYKELVRSGEFEKSIEKDWKNLADKIKEGDNLFLFPEGGFSLDGSIRPIKAGVYRLLRHLGPLPFYFVNLTFDFLSKEKPICYINYGYRFVPSEDPTSEEVTNLMQRALEESFSLTLANWFGVLLYSNQMRNGISLDELHDICMNIESKWFLSSKNKDANLNEDFLGAFLKRIELFQKRGWVRWVDHQIQVQPSFYEHESKIWDQDMKSTFQYHKNQLKGMKNLLDPLYQ